MDYLSKDTFKGIKGYLALFVLIHHTYQFTNVLSGTYFSYLLLLLGRWAVYLFIFMTGYGLYNSYKVKGDEYIKSFTRKRIIPYYLSYLLFLALYIIYFLVYGQELSAMKIITSLTFGGTIISFGWYLQVALFLYISFVVVFAFCKSKYARSVVTFLLLAGFVAFSFFVNCVYYIPVLTVSYVLGMLTSIYRERVDRIVSKYGCLIMILSIVIFLASSVLYISYGIGNMIIPDVVKEYVIALIMEISEITFFVSLLYLGRNKLAGLFCNKISLFLGAESLEIYAIQGLVLGVLGQYFKSGIVYAVISIVAVIILAYPVHLVVQKINKRA